jgi:hypothetical protein
MGVNTGIDSSGQLLATQPIMSRKSCRLHVPPLPSRRGAEPLPRNVLVAKETGVIRSRLGPRLLTGPGRRADQLAMR